MWGEARMIQICLPRSVLSCLHSGRKKIVARITQKEAGHTHRSQNHSHPTNSQRQINMVGQIFPPMQTGAVAKSFKTWAIFCWLIDYFFFHFKTDRLRLLVIVGNLTIWRLLLHKITLENYGFWHVAEKSTAFLINQKYYQNRPQFSTVCVFSWLLKWWTWWLAILAIADLRFLTFKDEFVDDGTLSLFEFLRGVLPLVKLFSQEEDVETCPFFGECDILCAVTIFQMTLTFPMGLRIN